MSDTIGNEYLNNWSFLKFLKKSFFLSGFILSCCTYYEEFRYVNLQQINQFDLIVVNFID